MDIGRINPCVPSDGVYIVRDFLKYSCGNSMSAWSYIHVNGDKQDTAKQYLKQLQTFFVI